MARAKRTHRAEARRRNRAQSATLVTTGADETSTASAATATATATTEAPKGGLGLRVQRPDVRADLRALPQLLRSRALWIPAGLMLLAAGAFMYLLYGPDSAAAPGTGSAPLSTLLGLFAQVGLGNPFVATYIPPLVVFLGGYLAPRAGYLIGLILAIFNAVLLLLVLNASANSVLASREVAPGGPLGRDLILSALQPAAIAGFIGQAAIWGLVVGGIASWYRRFLKQSAARRQAALVERQRQRQVQERDRAAEERRKAVEERRKAAEERRNARAG